MRLLRTKRGREVWITLIGGRGGGCIFSTNPVVFVEVKVK